MPGEAHGRRWKFDNFIALKPGAYTPLDGTLEGFDAEFSGTLALGEYTAENFAWGIELSNYNTSFDDNKETDDITIYGAKLVLTWIRQLGRRGKVGELYFSLGGGAYLVEVEVDSPKISGDDEDELYGGEVGLGFNHNLSKRFFLGVEGKYIYTTDAEVTISSEPVQKFSLEGYIVTLIVGIRFDFIRIFRYY